MTCAIIFLRRLPRLHRFSRVAQDAGPYVGIEGGILFPKDTDVDAAVDFVDPLSTTSSTTARSMSTTSAAMISTSSPATTSACSASKASLATSAPRSTTSKSTKTSSTLMKSTGDSFADDDFDLDGKRHVLSVMVNALADFGGGGFGVYAGGGFGRARVKVFGDSDSAWAYQLIAGVGVPIASEHRSWA